MTDRVDVDVLFAAAVTESPPSTTTIITPLFNAEAWIVETLESVRRQTVGPLDLVVVDDVSTDRGLALTLAWVNTNSDRFRRVTVARHRKNSGPGIARNTAVHLSTTPCIYFLDSDNLLLEACIERLEDALESSGAALAYGYLARFGDVSGLADAYRFPLRNLSPWRPQLFIRGFDLDIGVLVRRLAFDSASGFSTSTLLNRWGWEDLDFFLRLDAAGFRGVLVPEVLVRYRIRRDSREVSRARMARRRLEAYFRLLYPDMGF